MTAAIQIPCPHCNMINRLPAERRSDKGRCGSCHRALFTGNPLQLTMANFDRHAGAGDLPLLVDFWASWCGPCRAMEPVIAAAAAEFEPEFRIGKLDTEAEPGLASRFGIHSIPTMILFRGGQEVARIAGAMPLANLRQWLRQALAAKAARPAAGPAST